MERRFPQLPCPWPWVLGGVGTSCVGAASPDKWGCWKTKKGHRAQEEETPPSVSGVIGSIALSPFWGRGGVWSGLSRSSRRRLHTARVTLLKGWEAEPLLRGVHRREKGNKTDLFSYFLWSLSPHEEPAPHISGPAQLLASQALGGVVHPRQQERVIQLGWGANYERKEVVSISLWTQRVWKVRENPWA